MNKRTYINSNRHVTRLIYRKEVTWEYLEKEPGKDGQTEEGLDQGQRLRRGLYLRFNDI